MAVVLLSYTVGIFTEKQCDYCNGFVLVSKILKSGTNDSEDVPFFEKTLYKVEVKEDEELDKTVITVPAQNIEEGRSNTFIVSFFSVQRVFLRLHELAPVWL